MRIFYVYARRFGDICEQVLAVAMTASVHSIQSQPACTRYRSQRALNTEVVLTTSMSITAYRTHLLDHTCRSQSGAS